MREYLLPLRGFGDALDRERGDDRAKQYPIAPASAPAGCVGVGHNSSTTLVLIPNVVHRRT